MAVFANPPSRGMHRLDAGACPVRVALSPLSPGGLSWAAPPGMQGAERGDGEGQMGKIDGVYEEGFHKQLK